MLLNVEEELENVGFSVRERILSVKKELNYIVLRISDERVSVVFCADYEGKTIWFLQ